MPTRLPVIATYSLIIHIELYYIVHDRYCCTVIYNLFELTFALLYISFFNVSLVTYYTFDAPYDTFSSHLQIYKITRIKDTSRTDRIVLVRGVIVYLFKLCMYYQNKCLPVLLCYEHFIYCVTTIVFFMYCFIRLSQCVSSDAIYNACLYIIINTMY